MLRKNEESLDELSGDEEEKSERESGNNGRMNGTEIVPFRGNRGNVGGGNTGAILGVLSTASGAVRDVASAVGSTSVAKSKIKTAEQERLAAEATATGRTQVARINADRAITTTRETLIANFKSQKMQQKHERTMQRVDIEQKERQSQIDQKLAFAQLEIKAEEVDLDRFRANEEAKAQSIKTNQVAMEMASATATSPEQTIEIAHKYRQFLNTGTTPTPQRTEFSFRR